MEITELQNRAIKYIEELSEEKLYSALDYLEFLLEKSDDESSATDRLARALEEVAQEREGKTSLPTLEEFLNELGD